MEAAKAAAERAAAEAAEAAANGGGRGGSGRGGGESCSCEGGEGCGGSSGEGGGRGGGEGGGGGSEGGRKAAVEVEAESPTHLQADALKSVQVEVWREDFRDGPAHSAKKRAERRARLNAERAATAAPGEDAKAAEEVAKEAAADKPDARQQPTPPKSVGLGKVEDGRALERCRDVNADTAQTRAKRRAATKAASRRRPR